MATERERRVVFGEAVREYEAARPGYPPDLFRDVLGYAAPGPALEVGAGTGKATVPFAAAGLDLTCLEPDPRMAAVLAANCPGAAVAVTPFERWLPDRGYGLVYSAEAWHWVDPERRYDLAHAALAPGGALALFWNSYAVFDPALYAELGEVNRLHGLVPNSAPHCYQVEVADVPEPAADDTWPTVHLAGDARFTDLVDRRYRWERDYDTARYVDLLASISAFRMLAPDRLVAVLGAVREVVDAHGGRISFRLTTSLALARRG